MDDPQHPVSTHFPMSVNLASAQWALTPEAALY